MTQREIQFPDKDKPLRRDVSMLGRLVGEMLQEQGGQELYEAVEDVRKASIRRREAEATAEVEAAEDALCRRLSELPIALADGVAKAFDAYFQMVNLAEKVHRIRRRRHYLRQDAAPQKHSLQDLVQRLADDGVTFPELQALCNRLLLEPVFTAHPTQALRRTLLEKRQAIARRLVERLDPSMTPPEERAAQERIRATVTSAWQTDAHPSLRPSVSEEREGILFYVTDILYRIVPAFYEAFEEAVSATYGEAADDFELPNVLRFTSWVGGDMDGNPNVSAATIDETLRQQRHLILGLYLRDIADLARQLSQSRSRVTVSPEIDRRLDTYQQMFPDAYDGIPARHRDMPYRVLLHLMRARLLATNADAAEGYPSAEDFGADLRQICDSLKTHKGQHAGRFWVQRLMRRARCFGFHLATLDVRQDALVHRRAVAALLERPDWLELDQDQRTKVLLQAIAKGTNVDNQDDADAKPAEESSEAQQDLRRTLDVMKAIGRGRQRFGDQAIGPHIISMTRGADDILSLFLLAQRGGLSHEGQLDLDIAPLFETVPDLEASPEVMTQLLNEPIYRQHLEQRQNRQMIMVGYSDSNKEGGLAASRWELQRGQARLGKVLSAAGIELTVFHGRGGTVGRGGGGRTHQVVMASPAGTVNGHLRFTEQGETIDFKYGLRSIAMRTLERTTSALALATARRRPADVRLERWHLLMADLAKASRAAYRGLIYDEPTFFDYFRHATPIDVIERMTIGSRPSSRRQMRGIQDLRAIPWVFAWSQSRHNLPGWFGLGRGLEDVIERYGAPEVIEMAREWPFLTALLDDVGTVLAETDLSIAARYAEMVPQGPQIHSRISEHFQRTSELLEELQGHDLLANNPTLKRAIRLRNPYVDPMSLLQVDLLKRWRATDRRDPAMLEALLATVQGIAQGLQGTG